MTTPRELRSAGPVLFALREKFVRQMRLRLCAHELRERMRRSRMLGQGIELGSVHGSLGVAAARIAADARRLAGPAVIAFSGGK